MIGQMHTTKGAAEILRVKVGTIRKWMYEGRIPYVKIGGRVLFRERDMEEFVEKNYHSAKARKEGEK